MGDSDGRLAWEIGMGDWHGRLAWERGILPSHLSARTDGHLRSSHPLHNTTHLRVFAHIESLKPMCSSRCTRSPAPRIPASKLHRLSRSTHHPLAVNPTHRYASDTSHRPGDVGPGCGSVDAHRANSRLARRQCASLGLRLRTVCEISEERRSESLRCCCVVGLLWVLKGLDGCCRHSSQRVVEMTG